MGAETHAHGKDPEAKVARKVYPPSAQGGHRVVFRKKRNGGQSQLLIGRKGGLSAQFSHSADEKCGSERRAGPEKINGPPLKGPSRKKRNKTLKRGPREKGPQFWP